MPRELRYDFYRYREKKYIPGPGAYTINNNVITSPKWSIGTTPTPRVLWLPQSSYRTKFNREFNNSPGPGQYSIRRFPDFNYKIFYEKKINKRMHMIKKEKKK